MKAHEPSTTLTLKEELASVKAEIKRLEERKRELYRSSVNAPENEKLCENRLAEMLGEPELFKSIEYPVTITGISFSGELTEQSGRRIPKGLVRVRPCDKGLEGKTFLGLYLGDYARTVGCSLNRDTGVLDIFLARHNPAIWVPSLKRIVFGFESWWGPVESEDQLRAISNEAIDGNWYVQAMKAMVGDNSGAQG